MGTGRAPALPAGHPLGVRSALPRFVFLATATYPPDRPSWPFGCAKAQLVIFRRLSAIVLAAFEVVCAAARPIALIPVGAGLRQASQRRLQVGVAIESVQI